MSQPDDVFDPEPEAPEPPADGALFTEPMSLDAGSATCGTTSGTSLRLDLASGRRA